MNRYYVEMEHPRGTEDYDTFYIYMMAYDSQQKINLIDGDIVQIEQTPQEIAKSLCDQHVVKMPLEEAQMLCTTLWHHAPDYAEEHGLYKPVHQKHPCTLWAMATI